ncbi:serine/threonine-protein kinase PknD [Smaragdicoccus niigatensis]|uniref:serine/threonine-protein kinase PknD n=1 Tax=Smaragdicoccus niigatensis TaxID=359359 RepID=UPI00047728F6|nr:serine/threonine-protein kinase PknD [Smaragdicoccus niigatensis]
MANDVLAPGSSFAGYTIVRLLGRGGMGAVYVAKHPQLPRLVALKVLHRSLTENDYIRKRFELEAEHAARLDHPNIVTVYDRGRVDDQLWIAMKYVEGSDAAEQLRSGPFPVGRAVHILTETASALDYAHRCGILHRDVKPANILLAPGAPGQLERVMLADFGIAKAIDESTSLTQTGSLVATLRYASPEQLEGLPLDGRADVYSLACTFYHLLTGYPPYRGESSAAIIQGHLNQPIPTISDVIPGVPMQLDAVIARGLAKNRDHRYPTCEALSNAVREAFFSASTTAPATYQRPASAMPTTQHNVRPMAPQAPPSSQRPRRNNKRALFVGLALVVLIAAASVGGYLYWQRGTAGPAPEVLAFSGLSGPHGLAIDKDGAVLVVDSNNRRVVRLYQGQQTTLPFNELNAPSGLALHDGAIYVTDPIARQVWQRLPGEDPKKLPFDSLSEPVAVAVSPGGDIYVSDYVGKSVWVAYAQSDVFERVDIDGLSSPHGLAIHGQMLYIADTTANRVVSYDLLNHVQTTLPFNDLASPNAVAVNTAGDIYVTDASVKHRVAKFDATTGDLTALELDERTYAQGIAVDLTGAVFVSDLNRSQVIRLNER